MSDAPAARTPHTANRHRHGLMHVVMLVATFAWAANIIAGKVVLRSISPFALAQFRVTVSAVIFLLIYVLVRGLPRLRATPRELGYLAVTALFGITLNQLLFIGGIGRTSAAHAGLIVALAPVMVLILSCAMRLEPLTWLKVAGTAVSFVGVAILTTGKASGGAATTWLGDAILLAGSGVFAYYTILVKEVADKYDTLTLNTIIFVIGSLWMFPLHGWSAFQTDWRALPAQAWWGIAFIILFGTLTAYLAYAFALTELTASRVAAFSYLQPVIAAALGLWLLAEKVTLPVIIGGGLILLGVYLSERERGEEKIPSEAVGAGS